VASVPTKSTFFSVVIIVSLSVPRAFERFPRDPGGNTPRAHLA